ncbi:MAG TPA: DsbA family oxidoreductase [Chloroflexota bacterium]|nr:DsbA family oxidoreductase [Chloroflexota bacterium]
MKVEIWSDVVCPWCYIGKRRFETALAQFAHRDQVEVLWRSFELDSNAPRRSQGTLSDLLARKYGMAPAQAAAANTQLTDLAAAEGLEYHLDRAQHGNTFDAHRLIHLAAAHGLQDAAEERLMTAYFTEGLPIGDAETLVTIVSEAGVDAGEARAVLDGDAYAEDVRADERRASAFGIRGVPFVVVDEKYGVSGAQPSAVFLDVLEQAWTAAHPLTLVGSAAGAVACEGDSCAVPAQGAD